MYHAEWGSLEWTWVSWTSSIAWGIISSRGGDVSGWSGMMTSHICYTLKPIVVHSISKREVGSTETVMVDIISCIWDATIVATASCAWAGDVTGVVIISFGRAGLRRESYLGRNREGVQCSKTKPMGQIGVCDGRDVTVCGTGSYFNGKWGGWETVSTVGFWVW